MEDLIEIPQEQVPAEVTKIVTHVESMVVESEKDMEAAADVLKFIKTKIKAYNDERTGLVKPLNDHVKKINERFKAYTGPLEDAEVALKGKVAKFLAAEREKQRKEQERLDAERRAAEAKAKKAGKEEWELPPTPVASAPTTKAKGGYGAIHTREVWKYEVEDISKVPLAFHTVDDATVRAAIAEGARDIPGLRIYSEDSVVSR